MNGTLAIVLGSILILIGVVGMLYFRRAQKKSRVNYAVPRVSQRTPEQELNALGILEIRPKGEKGDAGEVEVVQVEDEEPEASSSLTAGSVPSSTVAGSSLPEEAGGDRTPSDLEPAPEPERTKLGGEKRTDSENGAEESLIQRVEETTSDSYAPYERIGVSRREPLFRLLSAVQASVDGYTCCLVKRDAEGRCSVEAIVSQNPQVLDIDSLSLDLIFEKEHISEAAVTVFEVGTKDMMLEALDYYNEPVAVRQLAVARVKVPDKRHLYYLLIDALAWQDLDDPWQRLLIGQFATLLGTFMATPRPNSLTGELLKPRIRPRREIIEEEIARARGNGHPLALVLVHLNQAEAIASEGPQAVSAAERATEALLEASLDGARIERFGELTFGIFYNEVVSDVEAWALSLQEGVEVEGDYFEQGLSIGIALLQDRHTTADDLRADATEALRESFETGTCTIIE